MNLLHLKNIKFKSSLLKLDKRRQSVTTTSTQYKFIKNKSKVFYASIAIATTTTALTATIGSVLWLAEHDARALNWLVLNIPFIPWVSTINKYLKIRYFNLNDYKGEFNPHEPTIILNENKNKTNQLLLSSSTLVDDDNNINEKDKEKIIMEELVETISYIKRSLNSLENEEEESTNKDKKYNKINLKNIEYMLEDVIAKTNNINLEYLKFKENSESLIQQSIKDRQNELNLKNKELEEILKNKIIKEIEQNKIKLKELEKGLNLKYITNLEKAKIKHLNESNIKLLQYSEVLEKEAELKVQDLLEIERSGRLARLDKLSNILSKLKTDFLCINANLVENSQSRNRLSAISGLNNFLFFLSSNNPFSSNLPFLNNNNLPLKTTISPQINNKDKYSFISWISENLHTLFNNKKQKEIKISSSIIISNNKKPFNNYWESIRNNSDKNDKLVQATLNIVNKKVQQSGIVSEEELRDRFKKSVAPFLRRLAGYNIVHKANKNIKNFINNNIKLPNNYLEKELERPIESIYKEIKGSIKNIGFIEYNFSWFLSSCAIIIGFNKSSIENIICGKEGAKLLKVLRDTENHLINGNIEAATRELNSLTGYSKKLTKNWLKDAREHLTVKTAIEVLLNNEFLLILKRL